MIATVNTIVSWSCDGCKAANKVNTGRSTDIIGIQKRVMDSHRATSPKCGWFDPRMLTAQNGVVAVTPLAGASIHFRLREKLEPVNIATLKTKAGQAQQKHDSRPLIFLMGDGGKGTRP